MARRLSVFATLAVTQITGWGVVGILPVVASNIANDLQTTLPTVFMGTAVLFVAMGAAAPFAGRLFRHFGARKVMAAGAALIGAGLAIVGAAQSVPVYLIAWAVVGVAGAMLLTTAAYVYLADYAADRARGMIASLMLVTGLAGSVFWPATAFLEHLSGWRAVTQIYAVIMLAVIFPLILFGLPEAGTGRQPGTVGDGRIHKGRIFWFLVAAIALNSFVTFGMEATGIELFRTLGGDPGWAVGTASFLGVLKVCGRLIDLAGGKRWDALSTGTAAAAMIPCGLSVLLFFGTTPWSIPACLILFGVGSGAFAVSRATIPLVFYRKAQYATTMSTIALPMNLSSAMAAPILSALLTGPGPAVALTLLLLCSGTAFLLLASLGSLRKREIWAASSGRLG
jgi:predicted MFS family arabinose efflux permease